MPDEAFWNYGLVPPSPNFQFTQLIPQLRSFKEKCMNSYLRLSIDSRKVGDGRARFVIQYSHTVFSLKSLSYSFFA